MIPEVFGSFADAGRDPDAVAAAQRAQGRAVVRTLGPFVARELLLAAGLVPVALGCSAPGPAPGNASGQPELDPCGRAGLAAIVAGGAWPLVIATTDASRATLFAAVREMLRLGDLAPRPVHGFDQVPWREEHTERYNLARLQALAHWVSEAAGRRPDRQDLAAAIRAVDEQSRLLARLDQLRRSDPPRVSGSRMLQAIRAAAILPLHEHVQGLRQLLDQADALSPIPGRRMFVAGSPLLSDRHYLAIEACGAVIVGEDHDTGLACGRAVAMPDDPWSALAQRWSPAAAMAAPRRAEAIVARALALGARSVVHFCLAGDESEPWVLRWLKPQAERAGLSLLALSSPADGDEAMSQALAAGLVSGSKPAHAAPPARPSAPAAAAAAPSARSGLESRSRKSLGSLVADFGLYQRDWFAGIRRRAAAGEPFAVINADAPQEIFRAFDVPFVVNQWWASIVAAKQQSRRYLELLERQGYPTTVEPYSAQGLSAALDADAGTAPWGGLPRPQWLSAFTSTAATRGIFSSWAEETGAELIGFDRTIETRLELPPDWWDSLPHDWDGVLEKPRLDLIEAELGQAIERIERGTGRLFDEPKFREVMNLVNEQEDWYRRTRDLIARTRPAPVGVVDTMPATMVPQWHRGTVWGRDAAKALHDAVQQRVDLGQAACPGERLRLMWVGRGLWSDMAFYQRWEESHGAVFVWTMYLALAADGYLRYIKPGQKPLRALAARFVTMGDELRMPTWAGAWHVHEARRHGIDAAVAISDADPFVLRALEQSGVPVLRLAIDNFGEGVDALTRSASRVSEFLDHLSDSACRRNR